MERKYLELGLGSNAVMEFHLLTHLGRMREPGTLPYLLEDTSLSTAQVQLWKYRFNLLRHYYAISDNYGDRLKLLPECLSTVLDISNDSDYSEAHLKSLYVLQNRCSSTIQLRDDR